MRIRIGMILVMALPLFALALPARGAWVFERLTNNSGQSARVDIALSSSDIHVVWDDYSFTDSEIFYKRSTNNGSTWNFQRLSDNTGHSEFPAISVSGGVAHLVWHDRTFGPSYYDEIFYKRSTNNGAAWSFQRFTDNSGGSTSPDVAASGSTVHVVWRDTTYGNPEIFYKRSTDAGTVWTFQRLSDNSGWSSEPALAVSGTNVHLVWEDNSFTGGGWSGPNEIFYKRSTDGGSTWSFQRLTDNPGSSDYPVIAAAGSDLHVIWADDSFGNWEVFYKRSTDNGSTWNFQRLTNNAGASSYLASPSVAVSGTNIQVVWQDTSFTGGGEHDDPEIFYKRSTDNGSSWGFTRLSDNTGHSSGPSIAVNGNAHVVWSDGTYGNWEIFYKRGP
jgi:hypothetical protein